MDYCTCAKHNCVQFEVNVPIKINYGHKVVADRGFTISKTLRTYYTQLVISSFTRGKEAIESWRC